MSWLLVSIYIENNHRLIRPGKKNFGSGQLIFENWSGCPVDLFPFFFELDYNINLPNLIFQKVLKLEIQIKPVLIWVSLRKGRLKTFMSATQNADEREFRWLTGEKNTRLGIFLGVVFILQPVFFLFSSKSTRPMTRTKTFFS